MNKTHILIAGIFMFFVSCKSSKTILANGELNSKLSTKQIVNEANAKQTQFNTLASSLKIKKTEGEKTESYTVRLRMEKDKNILLISTLSVVKALITPNRVAFYNKLDGTYFDGDFSYLSKLLGTELDFQKVQRLLLGEAILDLNPKEFDSGIHEKSYLIKPKENNELYEIFFLFNPSYFKLDSQQIAQPSEQRILQIDYSAYQKVENETLPEHVRILAVEKEKELIIDLDYKSVTLNESLRFPFRIPSGYKEIKL